MLQPSNITKLVFLGTGTPNPDPRRLGPAAAVVVNGQPYIVDAGAGLVRQAAAAHLTMDRLTRVFLTHLHSDHTIGLPDVILTPAVTGRDEPLLVFGPPGTSGMVGHILQAWSQDIETRLHGGEPSIPAAYQVQTSEFTEGPVYQDDNVQVFAFHVQHGAWANAYGLRFQTPDRVIVFSGDTTFCQNLIEHAKGCDILVHEVYSQKGLEARTPEWQDYHSAFHTSGPDVGRIANAARPKLLLLYHCLPFQQPEQRLIDEVKAHFDGAVEIGEDLASY